MRVLLALLNALFASAFMLPNTRSFAGSRRQLLASSSTSNDGETVVDKALSGYTLLCRFDGFDTLNMTATMTLSSDKSVTFSGGIESLKPGFWRIVSSGSSNKIEIVHPVLPEYLFFFDIWEPTILWTGDVDLVSKRVTSGTVTTTKKFLNIFPTTTTLATFDGTLYSPQDELPQLKVPSFSEQQFVPPDDFETPYDMRRFPELFDPKFVEWWFQNEDALARGEKLGVLRPQPYFVPDSTASKDSGDDKGSSQGDLEERKVSGKTLRSKGTFKSDGGKSFGKK